MVEAKLPKALLQQHCQRQGWPPPRFERCAAGGLRLPAAGIRYSVTLVRLHTLIWKKSWLAAPASIRPLACLYAYARREGKIFAATGPLLPLYFACAREWES